jgi:hypothetical protein
MKDPMSLENLPQHLKNLKDNGKFDENLVVDMGVVTPSNNMSFLKRAAAVLTICLSLGASFIVYNNMMYENITITLDTSDFESASETLNEIGGKVLSVDNNDDGSYTVVLSVKRNVSNFIERLRKNKNINKVELDSK